MSIELMKKNIARAQAEIDKKRSEVGKGAMRQKYHFMAEEGWLNDPNGLIYLKVSTISSINIILMTPIGGQCTGDTQSVTTCFTGNTYLLRWRQAKPMTIIQKVVVSLEVRSNMRGGSTFYTPHRQTTETGLFKISVWHTAMMVSILSKVKRIRLLLLHQLVTMWVSFEIQKFGSMKIISIWYVVGKKMGLGKHYCIVQKI